MRRDLRVLKSVLPPSALRALRRLQGLGRRITRLRYRMPAARRAAATQEVQALPARPLISLVMPTYKTELRWLREAVDSVVGQHYPEWELIVVDDGSGSPELDAACRAHAAADRRIVYLPLARNVGISAATNEGLGVARGEFVGFLDHDDTLTADALLRVAQELAAEPELDVVYSGLRQADGEEHPRRPVSQAGLVAGLRARRDVHRPPAGRPHRGRQSRRGLRLAPSTRSRTSSS